MATNQEILNNEFLAVFDKLEKYFQEKYKIRHITDDLIEKYLTKPSTFFWIAYRNLRNIRSHNTKFIANISEEGLKVFKKEVEKVVNPPTANSISTKNLYTITDQSNLSEVIQIMKKKNYSNVPVIDKNEFVKGMFNANTLFLYVNNKIKDGIVIDCPKTIIKEFKPLYEINDESDIIYKFVAKDKNLYDIIDEFEKIKKCNKRLEALLVTENGKQNQKIIGIITPWDMFKYISH